MDTLFEEAVAGFTWLHIGMAIFALLMLFAVVKAMGGKKKAGAGLHQQMRSCSCGWRGPVSKYNKVCPKCAAKFA